VHRVLAQCLGGRRRPGEIELPTVTIVLKSESGKNRERLGIKPAKITAVYGVISPSIWRHQIWQPFFDGRSAGAMPPGESKKELHQMSTTGSCVVLALSVYLAGPVAAQEQPKAGTPVTPAQKAVDDLRKVLDDQRALIDQQAARLEAQEAELAALRRRIDEVRTLALGANNAVAELKQQPTAPTTAAVWAGSSTASRGTQFYSVVARWRKRQAGSSPTPERQ
jgi:hypothetical protein